jgi:phosphoribosylformylglycinamidine synthase PurS subunit
MKRYQIFVTGKKGIFDPAGEQSKRALTNLGYLDIDELKIGKFIRLDVEDGVMEETVREMCQKLLANPVIEDFSITLLEEA